MSEEIRKTEISENELETVSGGAGASAVRCPKCGGRLAFMLNEKTGQMDKPFCLKCKS